MNPHWVSEMMTTTRAASKQKHERKMARVEKTA
jgi:hypothetical protein